jgi:hypothetical protein
MYQDDCGFTALMTAACFRCNLATFEVLFHSGANKTINFLTNRGKCSALLYACELRCEFGVIQLLLQQGADISQVETSEGMNALMIYA